MVSHTLRLKEEPLVSRSRLHLHNESARPQLCHQPLFSPHRPWPHTGHLSGAGLKRELSGTDSWDPPAGQSPDPTASENPAAAESFREPGPDHSFSTRTLSHPSFYSYYEAVSRSTPGTCPVPDGDWPHSSGQQWCPATGSDLLLPISSSEFFYTDPLMPPGHRIYSNLSAPSQEVCQRLRLNSPGSIMSVREASPPPQPLPPFVPRSGRRWLSEAEHNAVTALLELPCEESSPGTQLLLAAVELEYGQVVTPEAASALLGLHSSSEPWQKLLERL